MDDPDQPPVARVALRGMDSDKNEYSDYDDDTVMVNEIPDKETYPNRNFHIDYATPLTLGPIITPVLQVVKEQMTGIPLLEENDCHKWYKQVTFCTYNIHPRDAKGDFLGVITRCAELTVDDYTTMRTAEGSLNGLNLGSHITRQLLLVILGTFSPHEGEFAPRWIHRAVRNFMFKKQEYHRQVIAMTQLINGYHNAPGLNEEAGRILRVNRRDGEQPLIRP